MVILEGPDGAGKTSLATKLLQRFPGAKVGERGISNRDEIYKCTVPDTFRALREELQGASSNLIIWDRLYFSDFVYAPIQGRELAFSREERRLVEAIIRELRIPVVLCLPPYETALRNVMKDTQMEGVRDQYQLIYRAYDSGLPFTRTQVVRYDYTRIEAYETVCTLIDNYLERQVSREWTL